MNWLEKVKEFFSTSEEVKRAIAAFDACSECKRLVALSGKAKFSEESIAAIKTHLRDKHEIIFNKEE